MAACVCEKLCNRDSDLTLAPDQRREAQRWDAAEDMTAPAGGRNSSLQLWGDLEACFQMQLFGWAQCRLHIIKGESLLSPAEVEVIVM